jgi:hypothetical protein
MATDQRDLLVRILGDDRSLQRAFDRTERRTGQFEKRTSRLGAGLATTFRTAGIAISGLVVADTLKGSITAASDLNEEISKSRAVFGGASQAIVDWSGTTASAMGIAQTEALRAAGTFGNLFTVVGIVGEQSSEMSRRLVQLAADLASFNNASPEDVLIAIRAGLIGEAEPLRRFGVLLSEARVQQLAMAESGKTSAKELTNQEKALARYNIILRDTQSAHGDFARTADSLANQQRTLSANWKDLKTQIGSAFLPAAVAATGALNNLFATGTLAAKVQQEIRDSIKESGVSMRNALPILQEYRDALAEIKGEGDELVITLDGIIARQQAIQAGPDPRRGGAGPGGAREARAAREAAEEAARTAAANRRQGQTEINRIEAETTRAAGRSLAGQLADSLARARHLRDLIREDPNNVRLQQRLTAELEKQASLRGEIADAARRAAEDDKRAAEEAKRAADEAARRAKEQRQAATERRIARRQGAQFTALGLTAGGEQRVPGVGALRRRLGTLRGQVEGTFLDTAKTNRQLDAIGRVLSGRFGKVGRDVRDAILEMFNTIANALEGGGKKLEGPLTKTSGLNTAKIAEGMGLTPEQERELRARLSHFNTAGRALAGGAGGGGGIRTVRPAGESGQIVVESHTNLYLDGHQVTTVITRQQQKARRRNPAQKRGPNRHR